MWDKRYSHEKYFFGTEPNTLVETAAAGIPAGDVLCLADGEGRNGVHMATLGHRVTSVDLSSVGLDKTTRLAREKGVAVTTVLADLAAFVIEPESWDVIVSVFCHLPPSVRKKVHKACVAGLRPGGKLILEAYTPDQIGRGTGGPPEPDLTVTPEALREELGALDFLHFEEMVRPVVEGIGHTGDGAVVQLIAVKP